MGIGDLIPLASGAYLLSVMSCHTAHTWGVIEIERMKIKLLMKNKFINSVL